MGAGNDDVASHGALADVVSVQLEALHLSLQLLHQSLVRLLLHRPLVDLHDLAQVVDMGDQLLGDVNQPVDDNRGVLLGLRDLLVNGEVLAQDRRLAILTRLEEREGEVRLDSFKAGRDASGFGLASSKDGGADLLGGLLAGVHQAFKGSKIEQR